MTAEINTKNAVIILAVCGALLAAFLLYGKLSGGSTGEYKSERYGFSISYSKELSVKELEDGGAVTIVFENKDKSLGFQIFAVPYIGETVSRERFLLDAPSGVMEDIKNLEVNKLAAISFYGKDESLGDTYEIWIVNKDKGMLYEITAPRALEKWLSDIIETWLFT